MAAVAHILIVESRYYEELADHMLRGATDVLHAAGATFDRIQVPGAFEIPAAIRMAVRSMDFFAGRRRYDGYVELGCVIRGETTHYDYVAGESARKLQDLACDHALALGYGILTCENMEQAWERGDQGKRNKGGEAAEACLRMIEVKRNFHLFPR